MKCLGVFLAAYGTCFTLAEPGGEELEVPPLQLLQTKLDLQRARPNLLFLVLDQWRFDWDGSDGSDGPPLPTIDALGKSGVRFSRAYTPSPMCVPARSALAAVREYKDMWIKNNSNSYTRPQMTPTFMSVLRSVGYTTMLVGKDHLSDGAENLAGAQQAVDMDALGVDWFIRAVDKYAFCYGYGEPVDAYSAYLKEHELLQKQCEAYGNFALGESCGKTQVCDSTSIIECGFRCPKVNSVDHNHSVDTWVRRKAEELLQRHRETFGLEKPWFLQVNFLGPHPPLVPDELWQGSVRLPEAIDANFTEILVFDLEGKKRYRPHPFKDLVNVTETRQIYAQHLLRIDREIKSILQTLERYEMRNTVIVVTGDHGDHLGDLGHFAKTSPWESSVHVPLLVTGPSLRKNVVVDHPVSLIDVPMTFLDLAKAKARETMQGHSLMPALTGTAPASTGSTARPAVMFGLNYIEEFTYDVDGAVVSLGRKQFDASAAIFGSDFLKLICCPSGCRKQGGLLPDVSMVTAQVALMNVTSRREDSFEYNILKPGSHAHGAEALYLAKFLAKDFQDVCVPLLLEYGNGA